MNSRSSLNIIRFGAVILIALTGLVLLTEGAKSSKNNSLDSKPRTNLREIRGLKLRPQTLSTAIGFGKRDGSFRSADVNRLTSSLTSLQEDIRLRFPLFWYLQYLRSNPELVNMI